MRKMVCSFCGDTVHLWEEFYVVKGYYFHVQFLTLNTTIRCERIKKVPRTLEEAEAKYTKGE